MNSIHVVASLVDGGEQDWYFGQDFLDKLAALEARGLAGKALTDALISDDWGAPPQKIRITGVDANGVRVDRVISYD